MKPCTVRFAVAALAALFSLGTQATVVFSQPPSPSGGIILSSWVDPNGSDADMYAYDSFTLPADAAITTISWRGGYLYGGPYGRVFDFSVTFYESIAGGSQPHVTNPQLPEIYLAYYQVGGTAGEAPAGNVGGVQMYDYTYTLPTPFPATGGVKYWVRVEASQAGYPDWGMASGTGGDGQHFAFSTGAARFSFGQGDTSFSLESGTSCSLACSATASHDMGIAPLTLTFAGDAVISGGCTGTPSYDWTFGDGTPNGSLSSLMHTYAAPGVYGWLMTGRLGGISCFTNGSVTVCGLGCTASAPATGTQGTPVGFSGAGTVTGGCPVSLAYDWDFGDGSPHGGGQAPAHVYASPGTYTWTLSVVAGGQVCTQPGSITIAPVPPPVIARIAKTSPPFTLVITGSNLQSGIAAFINGAPWPGVTWKSAGKIKLGGAGLKAALPKGVAATILLVNPDGGRASQVWSW